MQKQERLTHRCAAMAAWLAVDTTGHDEDPDSDAESDVSAVRSTVGLCASSSAGRNSLRLHTDVAQHVFNDKHDINHDPLSVRASSGLVGRALAVQAQRGRLAFGGSKPPEDGRLCLRAVEALFCFCFSVLVIMIYTLTRAAPSAAAAPPPAAAVYTAPPPAAAVYITNELKGTSIYLPPPPLQMPLLPLPPPPLPPPQHRPPHPQHPPRQPSESVVEVINARWRAGKPTSSVDGAGVFVSQIDVTHDAARPWLPCSSDPDRAWCWWLSDRLPGSVTNAATPHVFMGANGLSPIKGGIVVAPVGVGIQCAYAGDGGSQGEDKACPIPACMGRKPPCKRVGWMRGVEPTDERWAGCVPGCSVKGRPPRWCSSPSDRSCTWDEAGLEGMMLQQQNVIEEAARLQRDLHPTQLYNEVVLNALRWVSRLPATVEAFFYTAGAGAEERAYVARARAEFMAEYGVGGTPLLVYDPEAESQPFREVLA